MRLLVRLLLMATLWVWLVSALAWDATGHRVIATIAYDRLTANTRQQVDALTRKLFKNKSGYQRFLRAAVWPDNRQDAQMSAWTSWHFIRYPSSVDNTATRLYAQQNLVTGLQRSIMLVANPHADLHQRALMLSLFVHLVGDAHQPLHCINRFSHSHPWGDFGANLFPIQTENARDLHQYWDLGLGTFDTPSLSHHAYSVYVSHLANQFIQQFPVSQFGSRLYDLRAEDWTRESYLLAIQYAYQIQPHQIPSAGYIQRGRQLVAEQSALAGYRLAAILNQTFDK